MAEVRFPETERGIGTYPVGLLGDIQRRKFRYGFNYLVERVRERNWRSVRNYFNGYLAEWHYPPRELTMHRCGSGWTRRAALRSLGKNIVRDNLSDRERAR